MAVARPLRDEPTPDDRGGQAAAEALALEVARLFLAAVRARPVGASRETTQGDRRRPRKEAKREGA